MSTWEDEYNIALVVFLMVIIHVLVVKTSNEMSSDSIDCFDKSVQTYSHDCNIHIGHFHT